MMLIKRGPKRHLVANDGKKSTDALDTSVRSLNLKGCFCMLKNIWLFSYLRTIICLSPTLIISLEARVNDLIWYSDS